MRDGGQQTADHQTAAKKVELRWPPLDEPYASALKEAVAWILSEFTPIGIVVSGSVLRGEGHATSDLDIQVIHREPWRQRVQQWFNGVPAELFVNPPGRIRRYFAEERREGRPSTAHMFATGFTVLAADEVVEALRTEAREALTLPPDLSEGMLTFKRYMAATALEDALDLESSDPVNGLFILEQAMPMLIQYAFLSANHPLPRAKTMVTALADVDPTLGKLAHRFYTESAIEDRFAVARAFATQALGVTGFFAWTGERQDVQV